jgi:hypothetical protein
LGPEAYHRVPIPDPDILHVPHNNIRLIRILRDLIAVIEGTGAEKKENDEYRENITIKGRVQRGINLYKFSVAISCFPAYHW